jgi:short subunit fatty acids transporter
MGTFETKIPGDPTVQVQLLVQVPVLAKTVRGAREALSQLHFRSEAKDALQGGLSILHAVQSLPTLGISACTVFGTTTMHLLIKFGGHRLTIPFILKAELSPSSKLKRCAGTVPDE